MSELLKQVTEQNKKIIEGCEFKEELTPEEYQARAETAEIFYKNYFKKFLEEKILEELKFLGSNAENVEQLLYLRGHINAYGKIKEWFEQQISASLSRFEE